MQKKIRIKSIYENKFAVEKCKIKSPKPIEEFYDLIFDTKGYVMTKEEVK